jgi:hypothetical protein
LIQILSINTCGTGTAGLGGGKRGGINRIRREPDGEKAVSGNADTASSG